MKGQQYLVAISVSGACCCCLSSTTLKHGMQIMRTHGCEGHPPDTATVSFEALYRKT